MPIKTSQNDNPNITLVGGAAFERNDLITAISHAPYVVAADSGADRALAAGVVPRKVIGDMDSRTAALPSGVDVFLVEEQDSTDFEKCLRLTDAPLTIGCGFLGGRLDHSLAALHALISGAGRRVILIGEEDIVFASPLNWEIQLDIGTRISFFPIHPCKAKRSSGLRWPIDGLEFEAGHMIGTSNMAERSTVRADFENRGCVTILPKSWLAAAVISLTASE